MHLNAFSTSSHTDCIYMMRFWSDYHFVMTKFGELSIKQKVWSRIESLQIPSNELLTMQMQVFDSFYFGFLYLKPARDKQKTFLETLPESLTIHR